MENFLLAANWDATIDWSERASHLTIGPAEDELDVFTWRLTPVFQRKETEIPSILQTEWPAGLRLQAVQEKMLRKEAVHLLFG